MKEAIKEVESWFQVHREQGFAGTYKDQSGEVVQDGPADMNRAPCGRPYVEVASGLFDEPLAKIPAMFSTEAQAVSWWQYAVEDYATSIAPKAEWSKLHLYWREEPRFLTTTYTAMNGVQLLQTASPQARAMTIDLGFVYSRMLISKLNPDGKEDK